MLAFLSGTWNNLCRFITTFFPASPFRDLVIPETFEQSIGWLNWLVPYGTLLAIVSAWAAAIAVYIVVRWVKKNAVDIVSETGVSES